MRLVPVDLGEALSDSIGGPQNIALDQEDELTVFSESQMKYLPTVQVFGEVRNPGYYVMSQGMHVSDLLYLAGGLKDDAYQKARRTGAHPGRQRQPHQPHLHGRRSARGHVGQRRA